MIPLKELIFLELYSAFLKKFNISKENIKFESLNIDSKSSQPKKEAKTTLNSKKTNSTKKRNIFIFGALLIGIILFSSNYQAIYKSIAPPNPKIVSSSLNIDSSTIFEFRATVIGNVMNNGGDGYVVVKAYVFQEGRKYEKSKQIYLFSYQTERVEFTFDEVEFLKKMPTHKIETFPLGSLSN